MKNKFSTSIPATMSNFIENGQLTYATLKVFHLGTTNDNRVFTKEFADKLSATIGGTPVVARFDEDEDDFSGHSYDQSVFGFVPEKPEIKFELDEDGNNWLITEVRLFTKRKDVGRIAKKIIGQAQSLELDPETVKYNLETNESGEIMKIEFTDGDLIGLSVLGTYETPAFGGSGFFVSGEDTVEEELEKLIVKYLAFSENAEIVIDSVNESEETVEEVVEETIEEESNLDEYLSTPGFTITVEEGVVYAIYIDENGKTKKEEVEGLKPVITTDEQDEAETETTEEPVPEVDPETGSEDESGAEDATDGDEGVETGGDADGGDFAESPEEDTDGVEAEAEQTEADPAALSNEEREELESYRRTAKIGIINTYEEFLSKEVIENFINSVDSYTAIELEKELSYASIQALRGMGGKQPTFSITPTGAGREDSDATLIARYINT